MKRRSFLKRSGILAAGAGLGRFPVIAGPFTSEQFSMPHAPLDKKLNPQWVETLFERGTVTSYRKSKNELKYIGMPVGGICCGTVYLGGDGRLWVWDIFNQNQLGAVTKVLPIKLEVFNVNEINNVHGSLYVEPLTGESPLQQGTAVVIDYDGTTVVKRLHEDDWDEVIFEATYPMATIHYRDAALPVDITMHAFSPFVPGNADDSGLPATIQSITCRNLSASTVTVELAGWLENKMLSYTGKAKGAFSRVNTLVQNEGFRTLSLACETKDDELTKAADFGNMAITTTAKEALFVPDLASSTEKVATALKHFIKTEPAAPVSLVSTTLQLRAGEEATADLVISWFTPNISFPADQGMTVENAANHYYTARFSSAVDVANHIVQRFASLKKQTLLWKQTWYDDSTLPWWFLERTFLNISTLATTTSHRFKSGRFYAWEGVGCCHGTCTHVYQYAQAMSRIFPALERDTRERVDLGLAFDNEKGIIPIRGEKTGPSIDGQAGTLLRIYREYLMSKDGLFLQRNWPRIQKAVAFVMLQDKNKDGMEDTPMENTLDALWSGEISWIVGLCIAGVLAGEKMAIEMNDMAFAATCRDYVQKGTRNMEANLFNGEYFIHRPDPGIGKKEVGSYNTCHIDQVYGQSWAWQVGLGRVLDKEKTLSALQALWKYNYMPDVGPYIKSHPGGRFYALAGDGGMVMNTNPRNDEKPYGEAKAWQIGYFSECMSGFEHQVASHMMAEGMVQESLVITKTIHDRYHAYKRNPFNEIECSDHYARAMASYGTFLMACGFDYNGPKGYIRFSPKWNQANFKTAFTAAEGWGSYSQAWVNNRQVHRISTRHGLLRVSSLGLTWTGRRKVKTVSVMAGGKKRSAGFTQDEKEILVQFGAGLVVRAGQQLLIIVS